MSRLTVYGAFLLPDKCILCGKPATITHGHAPAVSLDTLQSSGGSFAFRSIDMSARNGKPCKKCGGAEWYKNGHCVLCPRARSRKKAAANPEKNNARSREWRAANPGKVAVNNKR